MRVSQYAKLNHLKTGELLRILDEIGIYNKKAQSNITAEEIEKAQIAIQQEDLPIDIKPVEINSKEYYDVNSEMIEVYPEANYYVCVSPRGVGKSTNGLLYCLKQYCDSKQKSVYIRRRAVELEGGKLAAIWGEICSLGYIQFWTNGQYNSIHTIGLRCYLCKRDENGKMIERDPEFFMMAIPLSESGNFKGLQLNKDEESIYVTTILYDELFPVANDFLPRESELFFNCVSSIIRHFDKAKIVLMGNAILGSLNPILATMQIDILSFKLGEKRTYKYEEEGVVNIVAVHFINKKNYVGVASKNNKYFVFNNQKLSQITGDSDGEYGVWELNKDYNGRPRDFTKNEIVQKFFWISGEEIFEGDIVQKSDCRFIYHHKTGHKLGDGWLDEDNEIIFSTIYDPRRNWIKKINSSIKIKRVLKILEIIKQGNSFYQNAWLSNYFESLIKEM